MAHRVRSSALGSLMRAHRQRRDLTIETLAAVSGISDRTISDIERGVNTGPQARTVAALADALRLEAQERSEFLAVARAGRLVAAPQDAGVPPQPHRVADFSGRSGELSWLVGMIRSAADASASPPIALLITGPPGMGKTTLALEGVREAAGDAVLFVDLQGFEVTPLSPLQVLRALLRQVSGGREDYTTLEEAQTAWRSVTASSPVTVLLDNAASESQVRPVLATGGATRVVVTSRRTLAGLESAQRLALGPLAREESIALLRRSIAEQQNAVGELDEIARFCADLPLALRIAGARIASRPQWTVEDYATRLRREEDRLRNLVAGDLGVESTFALSYTTLGTELQGFFRSLSLLRGSSFSAPMAAAIHGIDLEHSVDLLDELVDLGLVETLRGGRYRMHDLLRLFAEGRMRREETDESRGVQQGRLQRWILEETVSAAQTYRDAANTPGPAAYRPAPEARRWLLAESDYWVDAIHEAARERRHEDVMRAVDALEEIRARWAAGLDWQEIMQLGVRSARAAGDDAFVSLFLSDLAYWQHDSVGNMEVARRTAQEAQDIAQAAGQDNLRAEALMQLSRIAMESGDAGTAHAHANAALAALESTGLVNREIQARAHVAQSSADSDREVARHECERILVLLEHPDVVPLSIVHGLGGVMRTLLAVEDWDAALQIGDRMVREMALFTDEPDFLARAYRHRGFARMRSGLPDLARADFESALAIARSYAPAWWTAEIEAALEELG